MHPDSPLVAALTTFDDVQELAAIDVANLGGTATDSEPAHTAGPCHYEPESVLDDLSH